MERARQVLSSAVILGCVLFSPFAYAEVFSNLHFGTNYHIYDDSSVTSGALVAYDNLFIDDSLVLENYGEVSSQILIANNTEFLFQNSGTFSGEIVFGTDSSLWYRL